MASAPPMLAIDAEDDLEALFQRSVDEQWGDGLPIVPPTRERVERALAAIDIDPDHSFGVMMPGNAEATVRTVAINAIMAGCSARMLPLVFAAADALCQAPADMMSAQVTTHPIGFAGFVSGPLAGDYGVNAGSCAFGPGNRANATVGRAIRLMLLNIGGGIPQEVDHATFGTPGKYGWFFAENQQESPFPSWTEQNDGAPGSTTVTTFGAGGFVNLLETTASADELIRVFGRSMAMPNSNDLLLCGHPFLFLSPEHARLLADAGLTIDQVKRRLWEAARLPLREFSDSAQRYRIPPNWAGILDPIDPDTPIPMCERPEDFHVVVAGGAGRHSVYVPSGGVETFHSASLDHYHGLRR